MAPKPTCCVFVRYALRWVEHRGLYTLGGAPILHQFMQQWGNAGEAKEVGELFRNDVGTTGVTLYMEWELEGQFEQLSWSWRDHMWYDPAS